MVENSRSVILPLVAVLSPWLIVFLHLCHLRSPMLEVLIPVVLLCLYMPVVRRANTAYEQLSELAGAKVRITGKVRKMKSGSAVQMEELTVLEQIPPARD